MESILISIKKLLGIMEDDDSYDTDVIIHINTVFFVLKQLGVGPKDGFHIEGKSEVWHDFIPNDNEIQAVKTYVFMKVKLIFDPGALSAAVVTSYQESIREFEWRLNVDVESNTTD